MKFKHRLQHTDRFLLRWSRRDLNMEEFQEEFHTWNSEINWPIFIDHAQKGHLAGYFLENVKQAQLTIPEDVQLQLERYQQKILMHHMFLLEFLLGLNKHLKDIDHVFLKGWDLAIRGYSSFKVRQISDIDILVNPAQLPALIEVLRNLGASIKIIEYKSRMHQKLEEIHAPIQAIIHGISIDVHTRLFSSTLPYEFNTKKLLQNKELHPYQNQHFSLLSEKDAALFCYLHAHKHILSGWMLKVAVVNDFSYYPTAALKQHALACNAVKDFSEMEQVICEINQMNSKVDFLTLTLFRFLSQRKIVFIESVILTLKRFYSLRIQWRSFGLLFFNLFPQKSYFTKNFGNRSYFVLWIQRTSNFFTLFFKASK